jgi:Flp pilus assembly protein TadB
MRYETARLWLISAGLFSIAFVIIVSVTGISVAAFIATACLVWIFGFITCRTLQLRREQMERGKKTES